MSDPARRTPDPAVAARQAEEGTRRGGKTYAFADDHDPTTPSEYWFQESHEGLVLFVVFYTLACRWSRCIGCNLPSRVSSRPVDFRSLMRQVDWLFARPDVRDRAGAVAKVIVSNNGSVLDEATFSSTALMYLVARLNEHLPALRTLSFESRPEYVDPPELEFLARSLAEGRVPATLELALGFEAFDDGIRNGRFDKGLKLEQFERLCALLAPYRFRVKTYFMLKPVPGMTDAEAVDDIRGAVGYLAATAALTGVAINMHLNPTYAATGTPLEAAFRDGSWTPPALPDVARAALAARGTGISVFLGLYDEGLACPGGSFRRAGDARAVAALEAFNRTQDFAILERLAGDDPAPR